MVYSPWPKEEEARLIELWNKGKNKTEILEQLNKEFAKNQKPRSFFSVDRKVMRLQKSGKLLRRRAKEEESDYAQRILSTQVRKILELKQAGENNSEIARRLHIPLGTVKSSFNYAKVRGAQTGALGTLSDDQLKAEIKKRVSAGSKSVGELSRALDRSKETITRVVDLIKKKEHIDIDIEKDSKQVVIHTEPTKFFTPTTIKNIYNYHFRIGAVSDTHLQSKYQQLSILNLAYDDFIKEKCDFVLHAGDLSDGFGVYKGQLGEQFMSDGDEVREYIINNYPRRKGLKTYIIAGNHDTSWKKINGYSLVKAVCAERDDLSYRGDLEAIFEVKGVKIYMLHPSGGGGYAKCFDNKTEILTENGWKLFKDLLPGEKVATMNSDTDSFEWQTPTDYTDEYYSGDMLNFKTKCFDLMVTPNHRLWVRRYQSPDYIKRKEQSTHPEKNHPPQAVDWSWQFKEAHELADCKRQRWQMTRQVLNWQGTNVNQIPITYRAPGKHASHDIKHFKSLPVRKLARLIAWYVTEGTVAGISSISIAQSYKLNRANCESIQEAFRGVGIEPHLYVTKDGMGTINGYAAELRDFLQAECGSGSKNKKLPKWLKNQPVSILKEVIAIMVKGDGLNREDGSFTFGSISKQLAEDFAEITIKAGYAVSFNHRAKSSPIATSPWYWVGVSTNQMQPTINEKPKKIHYQGRIYCVTVPNSIILTRRNGKTAWSGNSYRTQKIVESVVSTSIAEIKNLNDEKAKLPSLFVFGHFHIYMNFGYAGASVLSIPCLQGQTPYLKAKGLSPEIGYCILDLTFDKNWRLVKILPDVRLLNHYAKEKDYISYV